MPLSNKDKLLADWKAASTQLKILKADETALRAQVIEAFSTETDPQKSGVENVDVGWGYTLKIEHKLDYKLDTSDKLNPNDKVAKVLLEIERGMPGGNIIADRLVKWKPEVSVTEYKLLSPENKTRIDKVLTIKPASKSVELVEPKS